MSFLGQIRRPIPHFRRFQAVLMIIVGWVEWTEQVNHINKSTQKRTPPLCDNCFHYDRPTQASNASRKVKPASMIIVGWVEPPVQIYLIDSAIHKVHPTGSAINRNFYHVRAKHAGIISFLSHPACFASRN